MFTEIWKNKSEKITSIKEILHQSNSFWLTDLDDTIKEAKKVQWHDGSIHRFYPETVDGLKILHNNGIRIGVATEQTFVQIYPFLSDLSFLTIGSSNPRTLFDGIIIGEGGSIVDTPEKGQIVLAPKSAIEDKEKIVNWIRKNIEPSDLDGWFILKGTNPKTATYVQLPPDEDICIATASLWENGPHVSEAPEFIARYGNIEKTIQEALNNLKITSLTTYEAGNGTLRIVPKYINKAHSLELLSAFGIIDLSKTTYSCDGPNDVALARKIISKGGSVVAVGNAVPQLKNIATYVAQQASGIGFAEAINKILN